MVGGVLCPHHSSIHPWAPKGVMIRSLLHTGLCGRCRDGCRGGWKTVLFPRRSPRKFLDMVGEGQHWTDTYILCLGNQNLPWFRCRTVSLQRWGWPGPIVLRVKMVLKQYLASACITCGWGLTADIAPICPWEDGALHSLWGCPCP